MINNSPTEGKNVFKTVPVFQNLTDENYIALGKVFENIIKSERSIIITYESLAKGLYILIKGEIEVRLPEYEKPIAVLGPGNSFGEMSLLEKDQPASASVVVHSKVAEFLYCKHTELEALLGKDITFAKGFYRNAALMMSSRLRNSNEKINNEIARGVISAAKMMGELELDAKIERTRQSLDKTGYRIVSKLSKSLEALRNLIQSSEISIDQLELIHLNLKDVYYGESQQFDRLSQELQLIEQYVENVKRIIDGNRKLAVRGDSFLFKNDSVEEDPAP